MCAFKIVNACGNKTRAHLGAVASTLSRSKNENEPDLIRGEHKKLFLLPVLNCRFPISEWDDHAIYANFAICAIRMDAWETVPCGHEPLTED